MEVAAASDFNQGGAGVLAMVGTEAAVEGATVIGPGKRLQGRGGLLRSRPACISGCALPDHRAEKTVIRAMFHQIHRPALLLALGGNPLQADRANACGG